MRAARHGAYANERDVGEEALKLVGAQRRRPAFRVDQLELELSRDHGFVVVDLVVVVVVVVVVGTGVFFGLLIESTRHAQS